MELFLSIEFSIGKRFSIENALGRGCIVDNESMMMNFILWIVWMLVSFPKLTTGIDL